MESEATVDRHAECVAGIKKSEKAILEAFERYLKPHQPVTYADFFGMGIGRRALALSAGFRAMIEHKNSLCALTLVRMQLDTALRLYAGFFAADHQEFCQAVFHGAQINRLKSRDGAVMNDKFLVDEVATRNPWMTEVYKTTSGYIHFSSRHIFAAMRGKGGGNASLRIGPTDDVAGPEYYLEPMQCLLHINLIIEHALTDWFARMCAPDGEVLPLDMPPSDGYVPDPQ